MKINVFILPIIVIIMMPEPSYGSKSYPTGSIVETEVETVFNKGDNQEPCKDEAGANMLCPE